ncbi:MFS transporter [Photobacterium sp. CCB-ST2H9]|uniref:MFS transporter n=1 Tax=Photobacterium sp. CCB-ST2H9 TaxID=2912855 RepID=UPI002002B03B|nr:MFS transporter [Photobacterium sp. CCB-ST2H9]UTM57304.1 MFS transporter [Photobacterium sp. CCB-ST2H9]
MRRMSWSICGLLTLNGITILGNALTEVAIPWLILEISDSPALVAAVMAAKITPVILSTFFSAPFVDRLGAFRASVLSDLVNFFSVLLIPVFYHADLLTLSLLAALLVLSTLLDTPSRLAKDVILRHEIKRHQLDHHLINGVNTTLENICDLLGPVVAALIVAAFGTISALYFDAATFFAVAFGMIVLKKHFRPEAERTKPDSAPPLRYFSEGMKYLRQQRALLSVLYLSATVNLVITPFLFVYLPYLNKFVFESVMSLGVSMTCFGAGTSVSSLLFGFFGKRFSNRQIMFTGYLSLAVVLLSMSFFASQPLFFIQLFVIGLCLGFAGPIEVTLIQTVVPEALFGRVMTLFSSVRFLSVPAGYLVFGWLLESAFANWTPVVMASTVLMGVIAYWRMNTASSIRLNPAEIEKDV